VAHPDGNAGSHHPGERAQHRPRLSRGVGWLGCRTRARSSHTLGS
jgi:hypothetical protein